MAILVKTETGILPGLFPFVIAKWCDCTLADGVATADVALDMDYLAGVKDFAGGCFELAG